MVIGYQASPTKTKTVILVASASCGVTVLTQQKIPAPPVYTVWCGVSYNERKPTHDGSLHASRTRVFLHGFLQSIWVFPWLVHSNQQRKRIYVSTLQRRSAGYVPYYVGFLQLLALTAEEQKGNPRQGLNILDRGFSLAKRLAIPPTNSSAFI